MDVSYQSILSTMQDRYTSLAGFSPNDASDIGIRLKVLAEQVWSLYQNIQLSVSRAFPQTADGVWLERHAEQRGLSRRAATFSSGKVAFSRDFATTKNITIPKGTLVAAKSDSTARFVTTEAAVLPNGGTQVEVPVQSTVAGSDGNVAAGMVSIMITPVPGISKVTNPLPIAGAIAEESDEDLRQRLLDTYRYVTNGTNVSFYYNLAKSYPGVSSVKVIPRVNGSGTVGIVLYGDGVDANLISKMITDMNNIKELNVVISISKATNKIIPISLEIAVADGFSFDDVSAECKKIIRAMFDNQEVGAPFYSALLVREILGCPGVVNCKVLNPTNDVFPTNYQIVSTNSVTISKMQVL